MTAPSHQLLRISAFLFIGATAIALLILFPFSALQDFPQWIYQGYIFNLITDGHSDGTFSVKDYPVPYALVQLLISAVLHFFSPMLTSKIIVAGYLIAALLAARMLVRRFDVDASLAWPIFISAFVLNSPFWNGYIGYQIGLVVFAIYLSLQEKWRTDSRILCLFSVLAFFCHGMIYIAVVIAAAANAIAQRRFLVPIISLLPSTALVIWYVLANAAATATAPAPVAIPGNIPEALPHIDFVQLIGYKIYSFLKLGPYHNFIIRGMGDGARFWSVPLFLGGFVNLLLWAALLVYVVSVANWRAWRSIFRMPELLAGLCMVAISLPLAPVAFKIVNPGERLLYPAMIAIAVSLFQATQDPVHSKSFAVSRSALAWAMSIGFCLSAIGLIYSNFTYRETPVASVPRSIDRGSGYGLSALAGEKLGQVLFAHRLIQFDDLMTSTEIAWRTDAVLDFPIEFDTGLIRQIRFPESKPPASGDVPKMNSAMRD